MKKIIFIFLGTFFTLSVQAGVVMVSDQIMSFQGQPMKNQAKVYIDQDKSRVDLLGGMMGDHMMIYRKDKGVMWMIDAQKNTYIETTSAELNQGASQMEEKTKQMREKLAAQGIKLPPAPPPPSKPTYKKIASGETIGSWTCDHFEGTTDGKKTQDIWTAAPSDLGLTEADYQMMKNLGESMKNSKSSSSMPFFGEGGLTGIPVKFVYYSANGGNVTNEVRQITHQDTPSSLFEIPAGMKKMEVPNYQNFKLPNH